MKPVTVCSAAPAAELLPTDQGRMVLLRPVRRSDLALLSAFTHGLSQASRRWRFHGGVRELSPGLLQRMTQPDPCQEAALLAIAIVDGQPTCVGEARYAVGEGPPDTREFALVVDDAWQGQGLGTALLRSLVRHAQGQGVKHLVGDVMRDNVAMIELAQGNGFALLVHPTDPRLLRVTRALGGGHGRDVPTRAVSDIHEAGRRASTLANGLR